MSAILKEPALEFRPMSSDDLLAVIEIERQQLSVSMDAINLQRLSACRLQLLGSSAWRDYRGLWRDYCCGW